MLSILSKIILVFGCAATLVAAGFWMSFILSFDWGRFGTRSWGLWFFFAFGAGTLLVSIAVFGIFAWILDLINTET